MNHRQPMGQTKGIGMLMAGVALIVCALLAWCMVDQARAQPVGGDAGERLVLFLANDSLSPISFMEHAKPTGIVIDLAEAMAKHMHRPVEIRLMNWAEAQQLVLEGRADTLLQINPDPERLKIYDFSEPLLTSEFTIFTSAERLGITSMSDLRGLKVGVEEKGLPILLLQKHPRIIVKIIPDFVQGFGMLATGAVDAVITDRWVGSYVLAANNIRGVKLIEDPIGRSYSAIAVKKGNTNLLADINAALVEIRRDGTYDRITRSWRSKEVVFKTREQLRQQAWLLAAVSVALIAALVCVAALIREIRRRKRVEATLLEGRTKLETALASMTDAVFVSDAEGRFIDFNDAFATFHRFKNKDECLKTLIEYPEILDVFMADGQLAPLDMWAVPRALRGETVTNAEYSLRRKDTGESWAGSYSFGPICDKDGVIVGSVVVGRDITKQKRVEEELRNAKNEAERRAGELEALMDAVPALIWITRDTECLSMTGNRAVYEFLGMPIGANVSKTAPEAARPVHFKALRDSLEIPLDELPMQRAAKGEGMQDYELEYVFDDGTSKITLGNTTPLYNAIGHLYGAIAAFVDITERKRMEEELRKSRDELELRVRERTAELISANEDLQKQAALLNLSHDAIFVVDSADVVSFWNSGAADLYGFTREQAIGNIAREFLQTRFPESLEHVVNQVIDKGQWAGELRHTTSMGNELVVESRWALRRGEDGEPAGFLVVNRDITARKLAEEALRSNMARLELVNAELQEFAFVAAHDLQEPLRKIMTFCDMAKTRCAPALDSTSQDYLERVVSSASRMRQLLRDLLEFSRVAAKSEPFKKIDLVKIVREAADIFEASVEETGCQIEIENIPAIEADETQMLGLFQNLIGNALKFRSAETPHIKVYGKLDRKRICEIFVKDNGIGFDPKFAELIFKPFQRLHSRIEYDGTGMGLAICRKIVERHGGNISAESEPGQGSTFIIRLPVKRDRLEGV